MKKFTIIVQQGKAVIQEFYQEGVPDDEQPNAVFQGHPGPGANAEALGHAMFYLSCAEILETGVKLDIIQDE